MTEMKTLTVNGQAYTLADTWVRRSLQDLQLSSEGAPVIMGQAAGSLIAVADAADRALAGLKVYGRTQQNGTPAPDAPAAIVSAGDSGSVGITVAGTNLIPYPYGQQAMAVNGITFTVNSDHSITANGTATASCSYYMAFRDAGKRKCLAPGTYTLSGNPTDSQLWLSITGYESQDAATYAFHKDINKGLTYTFTIDKPMYVGIFLYVAAGAELSAVRVCPMLNVGQTALPYQPHQGQSLTIATPNGLPGIPVSSGGSCTDENGQQWICDEVDLARGVYVQNTKKLVLNGTQTPTLHGTLNGLTIFTVSDNDAQIPYVWGDKKGFFSHGIYFAANSPTQPCAFGMNNKRVHFALPTETVGTTVEEVKAYISAQYEAGTPLTVLYRLAEPVETALDAQTLADYATMHTNKPDTTAYNDAGTHMALSYVADTKTYIDNKFTQLQNAILAAGANI